MRLVGLTVLPDLNLGGALALERGRVAHAQSQGLYFVTMQSQGRARAIATTTGVLL